MLTLARVRGGSMETAERESLFELGRVVSTSHALNTLNRADIYESLRRHTLGDWGDLDEEDKRANDMALCTGERLLSAYRDREGVVFWIITEADRSVTTVLLPSDY